VAWVVGFCRSVAVDVALMETAVEKATDTL
jgi:hypothetical protein